MDLEHIRREYLLDGLRRENLEDNPYEQFKLWMSQAMSSQIPDPTAMVLATISEHGWPNQRIVLLKHSDEKGLVFYTNYGSQKAKDIACNPKVCLHFPWHVMERQVRISGIAEKVSIAESLSYFTSRPRDSQLAAWASEQSRSVSSRGFLLSQFESIKTKFKKGEVPLPDFWGGYRIKPTRYEFWQGGGKRLHDRFQYTMNSENEWEIERLAP